jgi:hypothetical protein
LGLTSTGFGQCSPGCSTGRDERLEGAGDVALHAGEHVLVGLDGERDVGVAEPIENDLRRFAVDADTDGLRLRWDGPPDAEDLIGRLLAYFEGDEPLTSISGLL